MLIFGLDFTSAPNRRKPITVARCELDGTRLCVRSCLPLCDFAAFEAFLRLDGPWSAACDFPFGQPLKLINNLGWPQSWADYVQLVSTMSKDQFVDTISRYCATRPPGDKLHMRVTDLLAGAISPMMLYRIPVGKMFFEGATRLLVSDVNILPCRPTNSARTVLEGYPALVARRWLDRRSYKSDDRQKQTPAQLLARQDLLAILQSDALMLAYGIQLDLSAELGEELVSDPMGDRLDAFLCAIQAAWAYSQRVNNDAIPAGHELEGWIVDSGSRSASQA
ncbi:MAG TPA: hypothetical protein VGT82_04485 [Ktedonobacteraceae bacterium]|nr:hypothetical protein [Ktedonobacteraceae bacterium]